MSTKFEFYLSEEDTERLLAIKEDRGEEERTGNEFAKELLEAVLYQLHPGRVQYDDETGNRLK